jgi:hydroxyacylglutathione hydrolase
LRYKGVIRFLVLERNKSFNYFVFSWRGLFCCGKIGTITSQAFTDFVGIKMKIKTVKSEGLAHNSYILFDQDEAAVIDPRRDCEIYTELAKEECAKIKYILETHRNEDYVIGSLGLQKMTSAEIGHSNALPFKYGEHNLADSDVLNVGNIKIKALHTPGHTDESLCYVVYPSQSDESTLVFTGDTLFAGSVGRTDLFGKTSQPTQADKLFSSLHEKLLPVGDHVLVYPAHGAGSVCGHGISGMEPTTLGYEKKINPYLQLSKEEFIKKVSAEELVVPRYFKKMEQLNLNGPPLVTELSYPKPLSLLEFEEEMQKQNMLVIDTRMPNSFAGSHIPNALSLWLGGTSVYPGWLLDISQYIIFVHERPTDIDIVAPRMRRLGFDNMCGYLCGGMDKWQEAGKPIHSLCTMSATELKEKLKKREVLLLDVRDPPEWIENGYVEGADLIFLAELPEKTDSLPKDKPIAVTCSVGKRSSIGASILERKGFENVSNVLGGMTAWTNLGYPTKH